MPRYYVTMCDVNSGEIEGHFCAARDEQDAIWQHPWIFDTFKPRYVADNFIGDTADDTCKLIYNNLSYAVLCENLDELIMQDLNAGDSSAC